MERSDCNNTSNDIEPFAGIPELESGQLSSAFGEAVDGVCAFCGREEAIWSIGGGYCSSECALRGLPEGEWTNFEEYLGDLRLKALLLEIYDAVPLTPTGE